MRLAHATGARCLALSCVVSAPGPTVLDTLCDGLPGDCELWLGGCAADALPAATLPASCRCLGERAKLREHARALVGA